MNDPRIVLVVAGFVLLLVFLDASGIGAYVARRWFEVDDRDDARERNPIDGRYLR